LRQVQSRWSAAAGSRPRCFTSPVAAA